MASDVGIYLGQDQPKGRYSRKLTGRRGGEVDDFVSPALHAPRRRRANVSGLAAEVIQENVPHQLIAKGVHLTRPLNERCGDLIRVLLSAEPAEPDAAVAVADGMRRHQRGADGMANRLGSLGALAKQV